MTSKQFLAANYQVTKIIGNGETIDAVVLREVELAEEMEKGDQENIYYIFQNYKMIGKGINGKNLKSYINQLSA
ncbi:hypothetical protein [Staphylococcus shinii]|uniref:hypothetical protein n=1 Tax=Staphylococcus shinii TaxID=2912228 RepID=UPI003EEEF3B6